MRRLIFLFSFFCFPLFSLSNSIDSNNSSTINTERIKIVFFTDSGFFDIIDNITDDVIAEKAFFQAGGLRSNDPHEKIDVKITEIQNEFGKGKALIVRVHFENYADIQWKAVLYDQEDFIELSVGIINDTDQPYLLKQYFPLLSPSTYPGKDTENSFMLLDGNSGGNNTQVRDTSHYVSFNNLMFQFGQGDSASFCVAGGLSYYEFEKFVELQHSPQSEVAVKLFAEDPVGKKIKPHSEFMTDERFYFCFINKNPFEALEKYGLALRKAQKVELNYYHFPTECLWYASLINHKANLQEVNNSEGAVQEMEFAIQSGITKYTPVAIRLVPDSYESNNQQGWWDDEHWGMYGKELWTSGYKNHYTSPYKTTKGWAQAIVEKGGIPFTYFQGSRRSEDFVKQHPEYMLFNDPYRLMSGYPYEMLKYVDLSKDAGIRYTDHWWLGRPFPSNPMFSYDYTDPGFLNHMNSVYNHLQKAEIKGIMYDYPEITSWAYEGGFEDKYTTTAQAYRKMYEVAKNGLGPDCYLDERNLTRGSDITLGLVASQRVWADTHQLLPEMITRTALRWYKNRVVVNYDMDSKDPVNATPVENLEGFKTIMTMSYVISGRFLMGRSFNQLSKEQIHVFSRTFPYHSFPKSARPIDAFTSSYPVPRIFDFEINPEWHQLTFFNDNQTDSVTLNVFPATSLNKGGLGMNENKEYYLYDFWNDDFLGKINGKDSLKQTLRPGETRMISIHEVKENPQFISTNRHIMQGYVDLVEKPQWNSETKTLSGISAVVGGEPYVLTLALNGFVPKQVVTDGDIKVGIIMRQNNSNLADLKLEDSENTNVGWKIEFE